MWNSTSSFTLVAIAHKFQNRPCTTTLHQQKWNKNPSPFCIFYSWVLGSVKFLRSTCKNKPIGFSLLIVPISYLWCLCLFCRRFEYSDPVYQELVPALTMLFKEGGFANKFIFLPRYTFFMISLLKVSLTIFRNFYYGWLSSSADQLLLQMDTLAKFTRTTIRLLC